MADISKIQIPGGDIYDLKDNSKQPLLVSGNNIKTLNGETLLGDGDFVLTRNTPLKSATFTHACAANNTNDGRIIFAKINLNSDNFYVPWQIHYTLAVTTATNNIQGYYEVKMGANGGVETHYIENNFYSSTYPIYHHTLYDPKIDYITEGGMFGVRVQSATTPLVSRTYKIDILEEIGCTVEFFSEVKTYGQLYNTNKWNYREFTGTSNGLQETADADTTTYDQLTNQRLTIDSEIPLAHACLFGLTPDNKIVPFSAYTKTYNSYTTSISENRVYPEHGIDWQKGMYHVQNWTYRAAGTVNTDAFRIFQAGLDLRYTDNCVASTGAANALGIVPGKPVFMRGVIKSDGLFYLVPASVTYNSKTYKKAWTQDIPTSSEKDANNNPYCYWFVGYPYYNASYPNSLYCVNFETLNPMYWYDGTRFTQYTPSAFKTINNQSILGNGNINIQGGVGTETDPVFSASAAAGITSTDISNWNAKQSAITSSNKLAYSLISGTPTIPTETTVSNWGFTKNTGTVTSVNNVAPVNGNVTLTIPTQVTESTVSGWGFTKNTGTYSKPGGGIPKTDLAQAVQTSLGRADTALQSYTETDPVFAASAAAGITSTDISNWNGKQAALVSGTNIKTINNESILGSGNITALHKEPTVETWPNSGIVMSYNSGSTFQMRSGAGAMYMTPEEGGDWQRINFGSLPMNYGGTASDPTNESVGSIPYLTTEQSHKKFGYINGVGALYTPTDGSPTFGTLPIEQGGTGATTSSDAMTNLGNADYVVAEGDSGIWHYRKWSSGTGECWCTHSMSSVWVATRGYQSGSVWVLQYETGTNSNLVTTPATSYPFAFTELPTVQATYKMGASSINIAYVVMETAGTVSVCPRYGALRSSSPGNGTYTWKVDLYVIGRWK